MKLRILICIVLVYSSCQKSNKEQPESISQEVEKVLPDGSIEVLDPALEKVISPDTRLIILAEGHKWSEGPLWVESQQLLLYSDIPNNAIFSWSKEEGSQLYLKPSGFMGSDFPGSEPGSNGLILDPEGRLILCQHGERRVARMQSSLIDPTPTFEVLADNYQGKRLNSPNDAVFKSNGDLYFTDPPYGLPQRMNDPDKELDFQGVYRLSADGGLTLLTDELTRPNGIAFSPDDKTLYVANSDPDLAIWMAYDVDENGLIANGRVFFDATERVPNDKGLPDGLKVDKDGIIYATGPGGVLIFNPEGTLLGIIRTGQATANCAFNADQSVLFITADMYVLKVELL